MSNPPKFDRPEITGMLTKNTPPSRSDPEMLP
jgi:hypothetical protein